MKKESVACGIGGFLTGALVGGVLAYKRLFDAPEDDDRPPIIVKGGSLIFQSGDPRITGDPKVAKGKPWTFYNGEWQPKHENGKKTKWFFLELTKRDGSTSAALAKKLIIQYVGARFVIDAKPRDGGGPAPSIDTGETLIKTGTADNPELRCQECGTGTMSVVYFTKTNERKPVDEVVELIVWPF